MSHWDSFPENYRHDLISRILQAIRGGECCQVVGLSGAGKSNLAGFLSQRKSSGLSLVAVDCNRLTAYTPNELFTMIASACTSVGQPIARIEDLACTLERALDRTSDQISLVFDRFDVLLEHDIKTIAGNLRWLRDQFKYRLTYVIFTRQQLAAGNELAELFYANTYWLGTLSQEDAFWSIDQFTNRHNLAWDENLKTTIFNLSRGYPSLLRAVCEAARVGTPLEPSALICHPAVSRMTEEFWTAQPSQEELAQSGLLDHPLLRLANQKEIESGLTAKETLLLGYLRSHPEVLCEKDAVIRAVWPEDKIFDQGIRDDSLAQLVRRLRQKIEPDPSQPIHLVTVPGRGYRYHP